MKKIKETYSNEIIINKSRFIAQIFRVNSIDEINEVLALTKKKYYDATHNCYAYILGEDANIQKCSDDGEPSKTAGAPILDVLKKQELTNILCIVTRYFGGILLGAGGLVRAYSESTSEVIKKAKIYDTLLLKKIEIRIDYSSYNAILSNINKYHILDTLFTNDVLIILGIEPDKLKELTEYLNNVTKGTALIKEGDTFDIEVPICNI
ncbi:MAG: YigZ family protein [Anaeroplasmataceae bacterium]